MSGSCPTTHTSYRNIDATSTWKCAAQLQVCGTAPCSSHCAPFACAPTTIECLCKCVGMQCNAITACSVCPTAVKYLYKYIYKGPDKLMYTLSARQQEKQNAEARDEIANYINARCASQQSRPTTVPIILFIVTFRLVTLFHLTSPLLQQPHQ
jgi:hypothetical protein